MTLRNQDGDALDEQQFRSLLTEQEPPEKSYTLGEPVYETYRLPGERDDDAESGNRLRFRSGAALSESQIKGLFSDEK